MPRKKNSKPTKPHPDYPLTAHPSGRWCKKIKGKLHYFGKVDNPQAALELWLHQKDDLLAGRTPRQPFDNRVTLETLVNQYLERQSERLERGDITQRTFDDYWRTGKLLVKSLGKTAVVEELRPGDFAKLRSAIGKYAVSIQGKMMTVCRMFFKWGWESELLPSAIRFGPDFKPPSRKAIRLAKAAKGEQFIEHEELKKLLKNAKEPLRTMILLGINGGLGNTDLGTMTVGAIKGKWLVLHRQKTGVERRIPLWPETKKKLETMAKGKAKTDLVFQTRQGNPYLRLYISETTGAQIVCDEIGKEFAKLVRRCELTRKGLTFYALRHTFQTIGDGAKDPVATSSIMGHVDASMAGRYRERVDDERLQAVVNHIRNWLKPSSLLAEASPA